MSEVGPAVTPVVATGRRKTATAVVKLTPGSGNLVVNGRELSEYFPVVSWRAHAVAPLEAVDALRSFDVVATIRGGGLSGQAGAFRHAVARALIHYNPQWRSALKPLGFLTRDPRMKERKKSGQPGARKRFQFSKR
ncbi:30S ribosomal protein S9 [Candidatus Methylacidithermus pantelleriae]|uniref:Small ribosomal subunit protein uS9 n=1 Tax=Candidatus Methylacidithermus pantelleriae TaxID=2744239 RepID=A0A8J2BNQ3_9BACT|nr:30S ribosomal protein S9 [Candidatus Methylacidithermus pantelleriae]CAF0699120.1 30S ribosomal subunit protein S9 [Candidatus Methylacidithermus pantelleriae]